MNPESKLWFTHSGYVWKEMGPWKPHMKNTPEFTNQKESWSWDNCNFSAVKESEQKIRIIVRSNDKVKITSGKNDTSETIINFTYDFITSAIPKIETGEFTIPFNQHQKKHNLSGKRLVLKLKREPDGDICEIWEWVTDSASELEKIHRELEKITNSTVHSKEVKIESEVPAVPISTEPERHVFPIIYQPAIDTVKNYLRQVHICPLKENPDMFEITLVFNNEVLRRHRRLNNFYEDFRKVVYGRKKDIETFHIIVKNLEPKYFKFVGIHSGNDNIESDTTHEDKWWQFWKKFERPIKFYYANTNHPKIFVNTSNHALAGKDNNPHLWKWEYVTWGNDLPIGVGTKSRKVIEKELVPEKNFKRIFKLVTQNL
ncbi:MAG: hypothetical protein OEQ12_03685 [Nitrosopumilus sp.]|nr:hypothetical protein [Nitrosopumilus sp.]